MNVIIIRSLSVISLVVTVTLSSQPVWADKANTPSSFLVEIGRKYLEAGKVNDAIHEFKKALLVNPNYEEAKEELRKLGVPEERYQGAKPSSERIREYQHQVAQLENEKLEMEGRINELQAEQDKLHDIFVLKNLELEVLIDKVVKIKQLREKDRKDQIKQVDQIAGFYADQTRDLKSTVHQQKNEIIHQQIALLMPDGKKSIDESKLEDGLLNLGYRVNQMDPMTQAKTEMQDKLIELFSEYLDLREQRFFNVENQMVFNEIDKARQAKMLVKKMDEMVALEDNADRYKQRIEDRDTLIVDKEKELELLRSELIDQNVN